MRSTLPVLLVLTAASTSIASPAFKDRVLLLKRNLNARAIDSLRTDELGIHENVEALLRDMQASIREADEFLAAME